MSTCEIPEIPAEQGGRTAPAGAVFLAAPAILTFARLLLEPLGDADWDRTLSNVAAHRGRSDAGWLLSILGCALMAGSSGVYVRPLIHRGRRIVAVALSLLVSLGWTACGAICVAGLAMGASAERPERETMIAWQESMNSSASVAILFASTMLAGLGYLWLAIELARRTTVRKSAAILVGLGGMSTLVTMPGPVKPVLVAASLLLAAGHWLASRTLAGSSPSSFAGVHPLQRRGT